MAIEAPPLDQSEVLRVWNGLTSADRLERYYTRLADRLSWRNKTLLIVIGVLSLATATTLFASLPQWAEWIPAVPALIVAVLSVCTSYLDYSRKAGIAASISGQCRNLGNDWRDLWFSLYSADVRERASRLEREEDRITEPASMEHGFWHAKLHSQCQKEGYEYCARAYDFGENNANDDA